MMRAGTENGGFPIPSSGSRSADDPMWGVQFTRFIARKQEVANFAYTPRTDAGGPHRYGHLLGLGRIQAPSRLELLPYATTRSEHLMCTPTIPSGEPASSSMQVVWI